MTLLDDARRLVEAGPYYQSECPGTGEYPPTIAVCTWCGRGFWGEGEHAPRCPWLSMPKIVQALEAADRVVEMQFAAWCAHANVIMDLADAMRGDEARETG